MFRQNNLHKIVEVELFADHRHGVAYIHQWDPLFLSSILKSWHWYYAHLYYFSPRSADFVVVRCKYTFLLKKRKEKGSDYNSATLFSCFRNSLELRCQKWHPIYEITVKYRHIAHCVTEYDILLFLGFMSWIYKNRNRLP